MAFCGNSKEIGPNGNFWQQSLWVIQINLVIHGKWHCCCCVCFVVSTTNNACLVIRGKCVSAKPLTCSLARVIWEIQILGFTIKATISHTPKREQGPLLISHHLSSVCIQSVHQHDRWIKRFGSNSHPSALRTKRCASMWSVCESVEASCVCDVIELYLCAISRNQCSCATWWL